MRILYMMFNLWGRLIGFFNNQSISFLWYIAQRHYATGQYKHRFKAFGKDTLLATPITLLNAQNIEIGNRSSVMRHCVLETCLGFGQKPIMKIGNNVSIGEYTHITCANRIEIGDGLLTGRFVLITDNSHGGSTLDEMTHPALTRKVKSKGPVIIGKNVWIGDKATILPGVTIGECSIIGANSVVTKDIPPYSVACGNPAKVIKSIINH